jgi:hypothetical protein
MPCEAPCTPKLHGIVAVRPSRLRLQYCLEAAILRPVSAPVEAKSTQAPTSFNKLLNMNQRSTACQTPPQSIRDGVYIKESFWFYPVAKWCVHCPCPFEVHEELCLHDSPPGSSVPKELPQFLCAFLLKIKRVESVPGNSKPSMLPRGTPAPAKGNS